MAWNMWFYCSGNVVHEIVKRMETLSTSFWETPLLVYFSRFQHDLIAISRIYSAISSTRHSPG